MKMEMHMKTKTQKVKLLPKIKSLADLQQRAFADPQYLVLAIRAAQNLGGTNVETLDTAMRWLKINANETDSERGVVAEVNFCR